MLKLKKGDQVIVIAGKDKGKRGEIVLVKRDRTNKTFSVIVSGVNLVKKHRKGNPQKDEQGGIVEVEAPIHISNVAIFNSVSNKADRVGFKMLEDGKKVRYFKSNNELIDV